MANKKQKAIFSLEESFLNLFYETLFHKKSVKLTGLGKFTLVKVKERKMLNPKILKEIHVPAHYRISIVPSLTLKRKLKEYEKGLIGKLYGIPVYKTKKI